MDMEGQDVPCHLLCIVDIPEKPSKAIHLNGSLVTEGGAHFLVHCALSGMTDAGASLWGGAQGTLAHADQRLMHRIQKGHSSNRRNWVPATSTHPPSLLLVSPKTVVGPCVGFPDLHHHNNYCDWFFLRPRSDWAAIFQDIAAKGEL